MKFAVFYLRAERIPLGAAFWGEAGHRVQWFFTYADRDLPTKNWRVAEALFFNVNDWTSDPHSLPVRCWPSKPNSDQFWEGVRGVLPSSVAMTDPAPVTSLLGTLS